MHTRCLRCGAALAADEVNCESCGANRDVEMAVAAELVPTISSLRRWMLVLGALAIGVGLLNYEHFHDQLPRSTLWAVVVPSLVMGGLMLLGALLAGRFPFVVSVAALLLFALSWLVNLVIDPASALSLGLANAVRVMFLLVLIGAVQSGYKARQIRTIAGSKLAAARATASRPTRQTSPSGEPEA